MAAHEEQLRRLALHDEALIESVLAMRLRWAPPDAARRLSPKTHALVRLAALLALGAAPVSYGGASRRPWMPTPPPRRSSAP
jgi:hypothetical protein